MDGRMRTAPASVAAASTAAASCPDCGRAIQVAPQSKKGQTVICRLDRADLELVSLELPEIDWVTNEFEASCRSFDRYGF
jgi:hypothetical protein